MTDWLQQFTTDPYAPRELLPAWQWCAENVDYSRATNYDTPYRGAFDPDLMPFWMLPLEKAHDSNTREIVILKSSRAGFSENYLLSDLRYTIARHPEPTLYITGKMDLAKGFLDRRVKRGMALASELAAAYAQAKCVAQDIQFPAMDFRATWSTSDTATKQDGWARIHCDEVSLWAEFTVDMVRRRAAAYPFHHIIFGGSIDPTRRGDPGEDPTLKLYLESDRGVWYMREPGTGELFTFTLDGIKWPEECGQGAETDLNRVEAEAWYETPGGKRIEEPDRMDIVREGRWQFLAPDAGIRSGFRITAAMVPFADCTFGNIAKRFLSAKHRMNLTGSKLDRQLNTLRVYFAEMWAEAYRDEQLMARDETLIEREADYALGDIYVPTGYEHTVWVTADVQKHHYWWLARVWSRNEKTGDISTALLDYGNSASMLDFDAAAGEHDPILTGVDIGYPMKATEVGVYCAGYTDQDNPEEAPVIALRGSETLQKMPIDRQIRDAYEGSRAAGRALFYELIWNADVFRTFLIDAINGQAGFEWVVPKSRTDERRWVEHYVKHVTSTRKADNEWVVAGHRQDHLWDCEAMQMVLASFAGLIT